MQWTQLSSILAISRPSTTPMGRGRGWAALRGGVVALPAHVRGQQASIASSSVSLAMSRPFAVSGAAHQAEGCNAGVASLPLRVAAPFSHSRQPVQSD